MERPVIILQSLLVLLTTFHVATGCMCSDLDIATILCNPQLTVIRATAFSAEPKKEDNTIDYTDDPIVKHEFSGTTYKMSLQQTFKTGPKEMKMSDYSSFETFSGNEENMCGFRLVVGTNYFLAGLVSNEGEFVTNLCMVVDWNFLSESQVNLLEGNGTAVECNEKD